MSAESNRPKKPSRYELAGLAAPFHSDVCRCATCQSLDPRRGSWIKLSPRDINERLDDLERRLREVEGV